MSTETRAPIICLEGPSAIGKTTLAAALAREVGAAVVPELDASGAPPIAESAAWFVDQHAGRWQRARALAEQAPLVVIDCDVLKGLWFNWIFAAYGWPRIGAQAPLHREHVARGTLAFPDLYVVLLASETQLRMRRAGDPTRTRSNFEPHLHLIAPQLRYFATLQQADPARVVLLDTSAPETLVPAILSALETLPPDPPDSMRLLDHMARWVSTQAPEVLPAASRPIP